MGQQENWRTPTNAQEYFGQQKRRAEIEVRRPQKSLASQVGPGIGPTATIITNFNDPTYFYSGSYVAPANATGAPNTTDVFEVQVIADATYGVIQLAYSLTTPGLDFTRNILRAPGDPLTLATPGAWIQSPGAPTYASPPVLEAFGLSNIAVASSTNGNTFTILAAPALTRSNDAATVSGSAGAVYVYSSTGWKITVPGVYHINMQVGCDYGGVFRTRMNLGATNYPEIPSPNSGATRYFDTGFVLDEFYYVTPAVAAANSAIVECQAGQATGSLQTIYYTMRVCRIGDQF